MSRGDQSAGGVETVNTTFRCLPASFTGRRYRVSDALNPVNGQPVRDGGTDIVYVTLRDGVWVVEDLMLAWRSV